MGVFTLFTLFTLFFDSAGWPIECKNSFVKVREFILRVYHSTKVLFFKSFSMQIWCSLFQGSDHSYRCSPGSASEPGVERTEVVMQQDLSIIAIYNHLSAMSEAVLVHHYLQTKQSNGTLQ